MKTLVYKRSFRKFDGRNKYEVKVSAVEFNRELVKKINEKSEVLHKIFEVSTDLGKAYYQVVKTGKKNVRVQLCECLEADGTVKDPQMGTWALLSRTELVKAFESERI